MHVAYVLVVTHMIPSLDAGEVEKWISGRCS